MNRGIFIAIANVLGYSSKSSRGQLAKEVMEEAKDIKNALDILKEKLSKGIYSSANYLLGNGEKLYRVENFKSEISVEDVSPLEVVTNYFKFLETDKRDYSSIRREKIVWGKLKNLSLDTIKFILTSKGICRYKKTLSSLIFEKLGNKITLLYSPSCKGYREWLFY